MGTANSKNSVHPLQDNNSPVDSMTTSDNVNSVVSDTEVSDSGLNVNVNNSSFSKSVQFPPSALSTLIDNGQESGSSGPAQESPEKSNQCTTIMEGTIRSPVESNEDMASPTHIVYSPNSQTSSADNNTTPRSNAPTPSSTRGFGSTWGALNGEDEENSAQTNEGIVSKTNHGGPSSTPIEVKTTPMKVGKVETKGKVILSRTEQQQSNKNQVGLDDDDWDAPEVPAVKPNNKPVDTVTTSADVDDDDWDAPEVPAVKPNNKPVDTVAISADVDDDDWDAPEAAVKPNNKPVETVTASADVDDDDWDAPEAAVKPNNKPVETVTTSADVDDDDDWDAPQTPPNQIRNGSIKKKGADNDSGMMDPNSNGTGRMGIDLEMPQTPSFTLKHGANSPPATAEFDLDASFTVPRQNENCFNDNLDTKKSIQKKEEKHEDTSDIVDEESFQFENDDIIRKFNACAGDDDKENRNDDKEMEIETFVTNIISPDKEFGTSIKLAIGGKEDDGKLPCLRCTSCGFDVLRFRSCAWSRTAEYMHFRNYNGHSLNLSKLTKKLIVNKNDYAAYACQCAWQSVDRRKEMSTSGTSPGNEGGAANGLICWQKKKK